MDNLIEDWMISAVISAPDARKGVEAMKRFSILLQGGPAEVLCVPPMPGMTDGFNHGAAQAKGDLIIFTAGDVHFLTAGFRSTVIGHMDHCDVLGIRGTNYLCGAQLPDAGFPHLYGQVAIPNPNNPGWTDIVLWAVPDRRCGKMQALDGGFLVVRREVLEKVKFDSSTFPNASIFDVDFTFMAYQNGFELAVANDLYAVCPSLLRAEPDWPEIERRFLEKHRDRLMQRPVQEFRSGIVSVRGGGEIVSVMTPPHWGPMRGCIHGKGAAQN